jgi:hypothetical protein
LGDRITILTYLSHHPKAIQEGIGRDSDLLNGTFGGVDGFNALIMFSVIFR